MAILEIENLRVSFNTEKGIFEAVKGISFSIDKGEALALVGESGAGKSVTAHSILKLLPYPTAFHPSGKIIFEDKDLLLMSEKDLLGIRGNRISMIFQEPMTSLNPLHPIVKQVAEAITIHQGASDKRASIKAMELFDLVQLPEAATRKNAFPHELSGGQRQRVMIAMALANHPSILIADEPTTALDVTIQAEILSLLKDLQLKLGMGLLLISHDLNIVRKIASRCCIMKAGEIVEQGNVDRVLTNPDHEYTKLLIQSEPKGKPYTVPVEGEPVVQVKNVNVYFPMGQGFLGRPKNYLHAVDDASFDLRKGETLGIVGESGSGKTTLALAVLRILKSEGSIVLLGKQIDGLKSNVLRPLRKNMQIVFQDPFGSLNPRFNIAEIVGEGLHAHRIVKDKTEFRNLVDQALDDVGIDPESKNRYPHEFSGGQRQRISIARAIILRPHLLILDEPTSSLDLSVQAQIIELLKVIQKKYMIAYLFISHDLSVVRSISHSIAIMEKGKVVEHGETEKIFASPEHPYTRKLLGAAFAFAARE
jgi:microcin C transport system ATP-binding protein